MIFIEDLIKDFASFVWGLPLLILLIGGGLYLLFRSQFLPFRFFGHAIQVLRGTYDDPDDPGQISHFQALTTALSATVGMGNISGVAVAIAAGGPGAIFWMWVSAIVGMATKFFTKLDAYNTADNNWAKTNILSKFVTANTPAVHLSLDVTDLGLSFSYKMVT